MALKSIFTIVLFAALAATDGFAQVPREALTFGTNIKIFNATETMTAKILQAEELIKRVVATEEFRRRVIGYTWNGERAFVDNGGLSNEEIYQIIIDAAERLNGLKNNTMDLEIEMYYQYSSTVGYTNSGTPRIYANTKFYDTYSAATITGNMTHEWLHKLGFSHAYYYSESRDHSVPYAIGSIMRSLAATLPVTAPVPEPAPAPYFAAPSNVTISNTASEVTLKWTAAASSSGISTYKIYRLLAGTSTAYLQGSTTALSFTQTKPSSNASYYVKAVDTEGKTVNSSPVEFVKLSAPSNLALSTTPSEIVLKWSGSQTSAGIKEYKIYRRLYGSLYSYLQGSTTGLTFSQTIPARSASYYVKAVDTNLETIKSAEVKFFR